MLEKGGDDDDDDDNEDELSLCWHFEGICFLPLQSEWIRFKVTGRRICVNSYVSNTFVPPNHLRSHLNLIQSHWRWRLHVSLTCWKKFIIVHNAIIPKIIFGKHKLYPKNLYPFANLTYIISGEINNVLVLKDCLLQCQLISGEINNVLVLKDCLLQCQLISRNKTLDSCAWNFCCWVNGL